MTQELGKIEKPQASQYSGKRILILIPLLFTGEDAPAEFVEKLEQYWQAVREQISNLENQLGVISRFYHESIFSAGEEGGKVLEQINLAAHKILVEKGTATLQATEDLELTQESSDWERCLMVAMGKKVHGKVSEFYLESSRKRYEQIAHNIDSSLKESEIGVLFIRESHRAQFAPDIEVFNVYPPVLDEIYRWLRDYTEKEPEQREKSEEETSG